MSRVFGYPIMKLLESLFGDFFSGNTLLLVVTVIIAIILVAVILIFLRDMIKVIRQKLHPKSYEEMNDEERLEYLMAKETPEIVRLSHDTDAKKHFLVFNNEQKIYALGRVYDFTQYKDVKTEEWKVKTGGMVNAANGNVYYADPKKGVMLGKMAKEELHQKLTLSFDDTVYPTVTYEFIDKPDAFQGILDLLPKRQ